MKIAIYLVIFITIKADTHNEWKRMEWAIGLNLDITKGLIINVKTNHISSGKKLHIFHHRLEEYKSHMHTKLPITCTGFYKDIVINCWHTDVSQRQLSNEQLYYTSYPCLSLCNPTEGLINFNPWTWYKTLNIYNPWPRIIIKRKSTLQKTYPRWHKLHVGNVLVSTLSKESICSVITMKLKSSCHFITLKKRHTEFENEKKNARNFLMSKTDIVFMW